MKFLQHREIHSDSVLLLTLLKELFIYLISLPYHILAALYYLLVDFSKAKIHLSKIFLEPFEIVEKLSKWFFEAKYTAYTILFLVIIYLFQVFFFSEFISTFYLVTTDFFEGRYWTVFTSLFLHANIFHLLGNVVALLIFGRIVEKHLGIRFFLVFVLGGILTNIVSSLISLFQGEIFASLGASSGIAALVITAIFLEPFALSSLFVVPLPIALIGWLLIFLDIVGLNQESQINHLAHFVGYLSLFVIYFFLHKHHKDQVKKGILINVLALIIVYFLIRNSELFY